MNEYACEPHQDIIVAIEIVAIEIVAIEIVAIESHSVLAMEIVERAEIG